MDLELHKKEKIMKEKLIALLNSINQLEVKGQNNILILYSIITFLQQEIKELHEKEGG